MARKINPELHDVLWDLEVKTHNQATLNLGADLICSLTGPTYEAAILVEELNVLSHEVDYNHTRARGDKLARLDKDELWRYHPSSPNSLHELLTDSGISMSEASDLIAWERHIYPYIEQELNIKPFELWQQLGKSKRRRLTPYLRALLDENHQSYSDKVNQTLQNYRDQAWDELYNEATHMAVEENWDIQDYIAEFKPQWSVTREVCKALIDTATTLTNRDMEESLSPERTPGIQGILIKHILRRVNGDGEITYEHVYQAVLNMTEDQLTLLRRRFPDRLDLTYMEGVREDLRADNS